MDNRGLKPYTITGCHTSHSTILPPLEVDQKGLEPNTSTGCHTSHSIILPPLEVGQKGLEPNTVPNIKNNRLPHSSTFRGFFNRGSNLIHNYKKYRLPHLTLCNSSTFRLKGLQGLATYTSTGCLTSHSIILPPLCRGRSTGA